MASYNSSGPQFTSLLQKLEGIEGRPQASFQMEEVDEFKKSFKVKEKEYSKA